MKNFEVIFEIEKKQEEIKSFEKKTLAPNFWDNREQAQKIMQKIDERKNVVEKWQSLRDKANYVKELLELTEQEEDSQFLQELTTELDSLQKGIDDLEFESMLSDPDDHLNAILTIHPGAGGTESQDWAQMLMRMYVRWIERKGFKYQIMDLQAGDEAGIKSVTLEVAGKYAFGYLKAEIGVHRLVRISPFDANSRRHTSFASVFVYPEVNNEIEITVNPNDLRVDTYRASGAGGQHVNKTSSAVRITHLPTGIVVQCQSERSQHMNRDNAMKILMSRLYQKKKEEERQKLQQLEDSKKDIAWGSQIRSYVFHPYNMVKDHRTKVETSNIQDVMDGNLDAFIQAYLMENAS
ncbi:MAG: peptide chain release factor 2 [Calditrichaeota bacterium]|nr:peptide chain release factor 2 [Calditrichota bacterium]